LDLVVRVTFARATSTLAALARLADLGFGVQAGMLGRSLFDDVVTATWLSVVGDRDDLTNRYVKHFEMSREVVNRATPNAPGEDTLGEPPPDWAEYRALFKPHLDGAWVGESTFRMLEQIEQRWAAEPKDTARVKLMWGLYRPPHRMNNNLLHHNPWAWSHSSMSPETARSR
jgi:hypothetical protein